MRLILTSSGIETIRLKNEFIKLLNKDILGSKILIIHTLQRPEYIIYVDQVRNELKETGFLDKNIIDLNISLDNESKELNSYDAIYVCGGNTFYILDRLRKNNLINKIKDFVNKGGVYIGVSAGSIIAGKTIEIAGLGSVGDINEIGLKDLTGLNFTNIAIFPHYEQNIFEELKNIKKNNDYPIIELKDKEAILILENIIKIIKIKEE